MPVISSEICESVGRCSTVGNCVSQQFRGIKLRSYVLRHGQSETNVQAAHAGWSQVPLTEKGLAQASAAGQKNHRENARRVI